MTRRKAAPWGNRIIRSGTAPASQFLANQSNWRIHPRPQQDVLTGMLDSVGFVQRVLVNLRTDKSWGRDKGVETLVDGHLRVELALSRGEETDVPVDYCDLTREEEAAVLASLDPIGAMAVTDHEKLAELVTEMPDDLRELTEILRAEKKAATRMVAFGTTNHFRVVVDCETTGRQQQLIDRLTAEGFACRPD